MLQKFETMASGRILLAEILDRAKPPLVVLYDTSQDDDLNINAACIKALQDKTLASPLQVQEGFVCVWKTDELVTTKCLSSDEQRLYERNRQEHLLRWELLLSAAFQRTHKAK